MMTRKIKDSHLTTKQSLRRWCYTSEPTHRRRTRGGPVRTDRKDSIQARARMARHCRTDREAIRGLYC